jgi:hypothetical protein
LNAATSSFANQVSYASGAAYTVAVGDFNGDGIPDLAVANNNGSASPGSVSVLLGNGDGSFKAPVAYAAGSEAMSLAVGDLNGDGILDLVVVNHNSGTVSVFLGNGDGTFQSQVTYTTGSGPMSAAVGDFNGDGIPDLAVTNMWDGTVSVLLGNGDGTFRTQVAYATGIYPVSVAVGDFNGDGILDLAVTNSGSGTISVFLGNGDGSFQSQITYAAGFGGESVAVGDFNGDGILDLAVANDSAGTISVLLGKGDGSFQSQVTYATGVTPMSVAVGDFNGDGIPDLAISNEGSSTVSILLGKGDGTFQSQASYATGAYPYSVAVGDFNGDGISDLAVANAGAGTVSALLGSQIAAFSVNGVSVPGSGTHNIFASYGGDASRTVSQSSTVPLTALSKATPIITVSCSPSVLTYGTQNSTCTASVGGGATGTVAFAWNGNAWSTPTLSGGVATATGFAGMPVGTYTVSVVYSGDSNNNTASASTALTVSKATPTVGVTCSPTSIPFGPSNLTYCTVNVSGSATGNTSMTYNGASWGSIPLSGGVAVFGGMNGQPAGTYSIVASYAGDSNYTAATGSTTFTVSQAPTVTEVSSSANPITQGGSTTFTALVDTGGAGAWGPASVAFTSNGVPIGSGTLSTVTTTNLLPYSQNLLGSTWTGYCGSLSNMTQNTPDIMAPDGTATAAKFAVANGICVGPGSNGVLIGGLPSGMTAGQSYTNSVWLRGAVGGETVNFGLNDCAMINVTLTTSWQRYTASWPTISTGTATCEGGRGFQILGANETYYMWGAQTEQSATAGPYVATGSTAATGNGGIATLTTTTLPVGGDSIVATYSGDANTLTSVSNPLLETVNMPTPQSITFTALPSPETFGYNGNYIGPLVATGGESGNPVVFSVLSGPGSITGGSLLYSTGVGTIVVAANQSGNSSYAAAPQVTQSVVVQQAGQTITIYLMAPVTYGVGTVNLSTTAMATASSGLPITYSVVSGPGTVSGNTLTITGGGTIVIAANQAGNAYYLAAQQATTMLMVLPASQTVTVGTYPSSVTYGTTHTITLTGTASSGLPVTFNVLSGPATMAGNTLTITGAGTIWLDAVQAGNASYSAGASPNFTITVLQATPTLSVVSSGSPSAYGATVTYTATITSGATGLIDFNDSIVGNLGQPLIVGTTASVTVTYLTVGSHTVTATYPNYYGSNYAAATSSPIVQVVSQQPQSITFASLEATSTVGNWPIELSATASSNLPVTFRVVSGPGTVSGDTLTVTGVGTIVVGADQSGNSQYAPALEVTQSTTGTAVAPVSGILAVVPGQITTTDGIVNAAGPQLTNGAVSSATYLNPITGLAIAANGDRYFTNLADQGVWKIAASTGILTQVAGCQLGGPSCSWLSGPNQSAPALQTSLNGAGGLVMDGEHNAYFTDMSSAAYKLNLETGTLTEIGSQFDDPTSAIAVDSNGNVYVGDDINIVWKYTAQTQVWSIIAGSEGTDGNSGDGGQAVAAQIGNPSGLATDSLGNLYISDNEYNVIRKVDLTTGIITTVAGTTVSGYSGDGGPATAAQIGFVYNMTTDPAGILYFADATYNVVRQIVPSTGIINTIAGNGSASYSGDGGSATAASLNSPGFMSIDSSGNLYVADQSLTVIRELATSPGYLGLGSVSFGSSSSPASILIENRGLQDVLFSASPSITGDFTVAAGNTCGKATTTLAPGANCSVPIIFTPTAPGSRTGTLTLADNGITTSQLVNLTGTGLDETPSISVSCSPSPITYGTGSTCTTVVGGGATGTVAWTINGSYAWGTSTINSGTTTNSGFTANVPGTYTIGVTYQGDADHNPASASTTLTITKAPLAVTLTTPSNPASYGTSVTFTAQVVASATGTITFLDGATSIGSGTVSGGIATFTTTSLAAGTHNITAGYSGDANYSAAVSALLPEAITKASATVNMTSSFSPSTYGQSVTFTFTATGVLGTPSGTIAISDGATLLATPTLNTSGVATFTTANLTVGSHNLTAVYGGDANYK